MKKIFILIVGLLFLNIASAQQWQGINSSLPTDYTTQLVSSSEKSIVVDFNIDGFYTNEIQTPRGAALIVSARHAVSIVNAGEPNLPSLAIPAIIGDNALMSVQVIDAQYTEFENMEIAPSKGDFPRTINPDDVPFTYGAVYEQDAFFPATQVNLNEPYILRDFRGQNMIVTPFSYNPVTKVLRVYHHLRIEMKKIGEGGENVKSRRSNALALDNDVAEMYQGRFINYQASMAKYNVAEEEGDLLIICYDDFMTAMEPFVAWKKQIGRPTTIVNKTTAGANATAIKQYITNQYNSNPSLTHILLIGDDPQIPGNYMSFGEQSGKSDLWYGQIEGNDYYNELFVGRFSAQNADQVTNQVNKVLNYERDLDATATWLSTGTGVATIAGNGGHFGEDDWQHIDNIKADLLAYNYTEVYRDYPNAGSSSAILSQHINNGVSIINYCNHGSETSWAVFNYSNSNVNALTNSYKLPYVISVACLNGKYDCSTDCFGEAWMHATNNTTGEPTGAIGGMFSYISQPWVPPMYGQDEMIDILVESYNNNIKRTMGGVSVNGNMKILDVYGSQSLGTGTYNTWILYGDPTLTLRNATPAAMNVTHNSAMNTTSTSFTVNASAGNGALATLTRNGEIMGSATINNGTAQITFTAPGSTGQATLTVFGYNKVTYTATINISNGGAPDPLTVAVTAAPTIIARGSNSNLNATASGGNGSYTYTWTPATGLDNANIQAPVATPTTTTTYTCTVSDGSNTATGTATITVVVPPTNLSATVNGDDVTLTWTAASPVSTYKVYRNNTMIAQGITATTYTDSNLAAGTYSYTVRTVYSNVESPNSNTASATVYAPLTATATANPDVIVLVPGAYSVLNVTATGGTGTYSYSWTPAGSLNNANIQSPQASPSQTTNYTVTVTSGSATAQAHVRVTVIAVPDEIQATANDNDITISWTCALTADSYKLYRDGTMIASDIRTMSYVDEDLAEGQYCYTVKAVFGENESPESDEACATIYGCPAPENLEGSYFWNEENFGAVVTWNKAQTNNTLTEFRVYRSKDGANYEMIQHLANVPGLETYQCSDMPLPANTYYYKVTAYYNNNTCESGFAHSALNPEDDYVVVTVTSTDEMLDETMLIYPNPTNGMLNVKALNIRQITVTNIAGQTIFVKDVDADEINMDLSSLEEGMYLVKVMTETGVATRKINVKR